MFGLVEVVRGQQHGGAVGAERLDEVPRLAAGGRVEPGGRLVEEEHFGTTDDPEREVDPAPLSARQRTDSGVDLLVEPDQTDDLVERTW